MKLTVIHSHHQKCGVREYGRQLDQSLTALGVEIARHSYDDLGVAFEHTHAGDTWLVHFEQGLVNPPYLNHYGDLVRSKGAKVIFCCHWYEHDYMAANYAGHVDHFVVHRDYGRVLPNSTVIPLGCPAYEPPRSRTALRNSLKLDGKPLPNDKIILTTIGFLTWWKRLPDIAAAMIEAIRPHPDLAVHLHTPWPFDQNDAIAEEPRIRDAIPEGWIDERRFIYSNEFLPEHKTLDVAHAADVGFVFHAQHTHSVSAATKQFVSARRPLVVTGSSHASDIRGGVVRVDTFDPHVFARGAVEVALDRARRVALQREMEDEYARMNMNTVAKQYIQLLRVLP